MERGRRARDDEWGGRRPNCGPEGEGDGGICAPLKERGAEG